MWSIAFKGFIACLLLFYFLPFFNLLDVDIHFCGRMNVRVRPRREAGPGWERKFFLQWPCMKLASFDAEFCAEFSTSFFGSNAAIVTNPDWKYFFKFWKNVVCSGEVLIFNQLPPPSTTPFDLAQNSAPSITKKRVSTVLSANPGSLMDNHMVSLYSFFWLQFHLCYTFKWRTLRHEVFSVNVDSGFMMFSVFFASLCVTNPNRQKSSSLLRYKCYYNFQVINWCTTWRYCWFEDI